ncbi:MAG: DUF4263 domain-containing protein [Clostridiales bacterium]|jgi:hypothetical protein|nr:DUF4263 domain-containing protein [Clostridiales bacterium]MDU6974905.1 DUF4263 domain-containing protein [Clostridiales bacterium]
MQEDTYKNIIQSVLTTLSDIYWSKMIKFIQEKNISLSEVTGFLVNPEKLIIYMSTTHLAIEYCGKEILSELKDKAALEIQFHDYTLDNPSPLQFFEKILGFQFDGTSGVSLPLLDFQEELIHPTNRGMDKLIDLGWNFAAQNSIMGFNTNGCYVPEGKFARLVNCSFFDGIDDSLHTRIIKWIDFIPLYYDDTSDDTYDKISINLSPYADLWLSDLSYQYPMPTDFKYSKLPKINRFIETYGNTDNTEPQITSFLEKPDYQFIMTMGFACSAVHGQLICEWQSQDKTPIKPDFFIVRSNGYADIVEFKLPYVKGNTVVGRENREQFSSEINSYIAQTRVYKQYFDDPANRTWFEQKYGFKVYKPRRYLVVGRRWDFNSDIWMEIKSEYPDLEILTYDDLVDNVVIQFYL